MGKELSAGKIKNLCGGIFISIALWSGVASAENPVQVAFPEEILDPPWLESRRQAQLETAEGFEIFHDFKFTDSLKESGITFVHRIVDDAGRHFKPNHYDHGNGIAVADVDGDGREDIYFVTQVGGNELWRNLGAGKFADITARAGVAVADRIGVSASFADIDNDGDPDLYVTSVRGGNILFENDGTGAFRDISESAGLAYQGHSSAGVFFDYNRDGLLDLFLANVGQYTKSGMAVENIGFSRDADKGYRYFVGFSDAFAGHLKPGRSERSILYENKGGNRFVDVSLQTKLIDKSWSGDATPVDLNEDGWIDLYVLNMQGHDEYYENVAGQYFVRKSRAVFPRTPWGSMGGKFFDYDNDGRMDLYITDMHSDMSERIGVESEKLKANMVWAESFLRSGGNSIYGNAFYHNRGDEGFVEISDAIGAENYWPWGFSIGDLNADGYEDAFVAASMNYSYRYGVNSVLLNNQGKGFLDSEFILAIEPRPGGRTAKPWFELDCSGADKEHPDCKGREGRAVFWGALGSRTAAIFDLDGDGDLDIVTGEFNAEPMVLISDLSERLSDLRFLEVALVGSRSNRDGLGARIRVVVPGQTYTKVHDGQSGYLSQSLKPLYFGLGSATVVEKIEVLWPSGQEQVVAGPLATNRRLEIVEP